MFGYRLSGMRFSGSVGGCGRGRNGLGALSAAYAQVMEYGLMFNVYWVIKNCTLAGWRECPTFGVQFTFFQTAFFIFNQALRFTRRYFAQSGRCFR